jgi:hypothetical protein
MGNWQKRGVSCSRRLQTYIENLYGALRCSLVACAILAIFVPSRGEAQGAQELESDACVRNVLFFGNSYTYFNDLPAILSELAKAGHRCKVDTHMVAPGGVRLKDLWDRAEAHTALNSRRWDYVVLQDQSTLGVDYYFEGKPHVTTDEVFRPYAEKWAAQIAQHGARPVFYLTWARKATPEDQAALNYAYIHAAKATGGIVAPVGLAWQQVRHESSTIDLYLKDGSHPSQAGSYLAACAIYAAIFHRSPVDLPSHITGPPVNLDTEKLEPEKTVVLVDLSPSDAQILQRAAWQAWQSLEKSGGYPDVHPARVPVPAFASGEPLSPENVSGSWSGELLFYPGIGAVEMVLHLQRDGSSWKGHLNINYPVKDFAAESFDLTDLRMEKTTLTFTDPKSAGVNNWRIEFRGALRAKELKGIAETKVQQKESPPVVLLGDWILHKQNP